MRFEMYRDAGGEWRWRLRHQNGQVMAESGEGYSRRDDCEHGIDVLKQSAGQAPIVDMSLKIAGT